MYEKFGMAVKVKRVVCEVVEWVKHGVLRWFGHVMKMKEKEFLKRLNEGRIGGGSISRRPVKWISNVSK